MALALRVFMTRDLARACPYGTAFQIIDAPARADKFLWDRFGVTSDNDCPIIVTAQSSHQWRESKEDAQALVASVLNAIAALIASINPTDPWDGEDDIPLTPP